MKNVLMPIGVAAAVGFGLWVCHNSRAAMAANYEARIASLVAEQNTLRLEAFEANAKIKEANDKAADFAAKLAAQQLGVIDVEYRTITKYVDRIIDRPVYRNQCFDADGVRQLNEFIIGSRD